MSTITSTADTYRTSTADTYRLLQTLQGQPTDLAALRLALLLDVSQLQDLAYASDASDDGDQTTLALRVVIHTRQLADDEIGRLEAWQLSQRMYGMPTHVAALRFVMRLDIDELRDMAAVNEIAGDGDKPTLALRVVVHGRQLDHDEFVALKAWQRKALGKKRAAAAACN